MESMWTIGNVECSFPEIHGVSTKSSWTLHGVCGNVWGSVKYSHIHSFILKLCNGLMPATDDKWASFLYEDGVFNSEAVDKCIFIGYFFVHVSKDPFSCYTVMQANLESVMVAYLHSACIGTQHLALPVHWAKNVTQKFMV